MRAKRIYLQILPATGDGMPDILDYKKLLLLQLSEAPAGGMTIGQMKARFSLIESLEAADEHWDVEYAAWDAIVKEFEKKKWGVVTRNIVKFVDDIRDAKDAIEEGTVAVFPEGALEEGVNAE